MKNRVFRYLTHGIPRGILIKLHRPHSERSWDRLKGDLSPAQDLVAQISEANITSMDARAHLIWYTVNVRENARRRRRSGLSSKRSAKLIERLRHALDHWPDPRRLDVIELEALKRDIMTDKLPSRPRGKVKPCRDFSLKQAA